MNFQEAMVQVNQTSWALWSDGVYHIAKEPQLLFPTNFDNIFLGLRAFHITKIIINCLGQYLEDSGIVEALVETEVFGPKVVKTVLKGSHYFRGVRGMGIIAEVLQRIELREFFAIIEHEIYKPLFTHLKTMEVACVEKDHLNAKKKMEDMHHLLQDFNVDFSFSQFIKTGVEKSKVFCYWTFFLYELFLVMRDII